MNCEMKTEQDIIRELRDIFDKYSDKRILVLGTTCAGKTTLLKHFPEGLDMDVVVMGTLPEELQDRFRKAPRPFAQDLVEIWNKYLETAIQTVEIEAGHPLFAATVFRSDIIVYLNISDETLRERTMKRNFKYELAEKYNNLFKDYLKITELPVIIVDIP